MTLPIHSLARSLQLLKIELGESRRPSTPGTVVATTAGAAAAQTTPAIRSAISRLPEKLWGGIFHEIGTWREFAIHLFVEVTLYPDKD